MDRKQAQNIVKEWAFETLTGVHPFDHPTPSWSKRDQALVLHEKKKFLSQIHSHVTKITLSSNKQDWLTPNYFIDLVRLLGPIALDPCGNPYSFVNAWTTFYGLNHIDGLIARWFVPKDTVVWCNPPYGRTLDKWTNKMATEGEAIAKANAHLVALIPARTGTGYWDRYIWPFADAVCFWTGGTQHPSRMCFYDLSGRPADTGATFDAAVVYFGKRRDRFQQVFGSYGNVQLVN